MLSGSSMPSKASILFATSMVFVGAVGACTRDEQPTTVPEQGVDASSTDDGSRISSVPDADSSDAGSSDAGATCSRCFSFDPGSYSRACKQDTDCVVLIGISNCNTCCQNAPVARGEAERASEATIEACGRAIGGCTIVCTPGGAICHEGMCIKGDRTPMYCPAVATPDAGATDGGPPLDPGTSTSCAVHGVRTGFEDGLDPSWLVTEPAAVSIDRGQPVSGKTSLLLNYAKDGYVTIAQPDACAVRLAFTVRAQVSTGGLTLARIATGPSSWLHLRLEACKLFVGQEVRTPTTVIQGDNLAMPWPWPSLAARIVLTVDTRAKSYSLSVAPAGEPFPEPRTTEFILGRPENGTIKAIELGKAPGQPSNVVGMVWFDDLVID